MVEMFCVILWWTTMYTGTLWATGNGNKISNQIIIETNRGNDSINNSLEWRIINFCEFSLFVRSFGALSLCIGAFVCHADTLNESPVNSNVCVCTVQCVSVRSFILFNASSSLFIRVIAVVSMCFLIHFIGSTWASRWFSLNEKIQRVHHPSSSSSSSSS